MTAEKHKQRPLSTGHLSIGMILHSLVPNSCRFRRMSRGILLMNGLLMCGAIAQESRSFCGTQPACSSWAMMLIQREHRTPRTTKLITSGGREFFAVSNSLLALLYGYSELMIITMHVMYSFARGHHHKLK
jgi:hypothetical protein